MAKLVNWADFDRKIREKRLAIFSSLDVRRIFGVSKVAATFLLHRYTKRGLLRRPKNGLYFLRDARIPDPYLANKLCEPSYVSLEYALSYHRVIPEIVYGITSITTNTTRRFVSLGRIFTYRHINKRAFTGYSAKKQGELTFLIADPEKAFVDLIYLKTVSGERPISRFDKEKINSERAMRYAKLFNNKKLIAIIKTTLR